MDELFERLYHIDPDLTEWILRQESGFASAFASGYADLMNVDAARLESYCRIVKEAGQNGPTLGRIMATYLVPVLRYGSNGFSEQFLHTLEVMQSKGTYTLTSPLDALSDMLNSGDIQSGPEYLSLLRDTFSQEMSYNRSLRLVHLLPKAILAFSPSKRCWQIGQLRRVVATDFRLAEPFLDAMDKGLRLLSEQALERFVSVGLEKFQNDPAPGIRFLSLESKIGIDTYSDMLVTVSISQVRNPLNRYLRARTGLGLSVRPLSDLPKLFSEEINGNPSICPVCSDGKFIYLPDEISRSESRSENAELYKCLTKLESLYYEFGTFDFDLEKMRQRWVSPTLQGEIQKSFDENPPSDFSDDFEKFFLMFPVKELAADLFTIFEHGRIRLIMNRRYPGMARQIFPLLRKEAEQTDQPETSSLVFTLYRRIAIGRVGETHLCQGVDASESGDGGFHPPYDFRMGDSIKHHINRIAESFEQKIEQNPSVETCAEMVSEIYSQICDLIQTRFYKPMRIPFNRKLRPDLFFSTYRNIEQLSEKIRIRIEEKGGKAYKSDIRKCMLENDGRISPENIREILKSRAENGNQDAEHLNLSSEDLKEIVNHPEIRAIISETENASGPVSWYREWDCNLGDYLHNHVRVSDRVINPIESDFYPLTLTRHRGIVRYIRRAFEMLKPEGLSILRQWIEGDAFDYRALLDFAMDRKAGITPSERLYIKRIKQQRDVAVLLLADLSRSTANPVPGSQQCVSDVEKEALVLFCEALTVVGDAFAIAGFSGTGRLGVDYFRIKDFDETLDNTVKQRINAISPQRSTRMGAAIRHATAQLEKVSAKVRLMIILGDGFPNDTEYKSDYAIEDTRRAIFEARSKHIYAKAVTVNLAGDPRLDDLYGSMHHTVISDVRELPDKLLRIYSALTR